MVVLTSRGVGYHRHGTGLLVGVVVRTIVVVVIVVRLRLLLIVDVFRLLGSLISNNPGKNGKSRTD